VDSGRSFSMGSDFTTPEAPRPTGWRGRVPWIELPRRSRNAQFQESSLKATGHRTMARGPLIPADIPAPTSLRALRPCPPSVFVPRPGSVSQASDRLVGSIAPGAQLAPS